MEQIDEVLGQYKGRWALLSKKTGKPLAYAPGSEKPSEEWVAKQERRVQYFKHMGEQYGIGSMGVIGVGAVAEDGPEPKKRKKKLKEDSTPSQMFGMDIGTEVGIQGGPLGESDPKKKKRKKLKEDLAGAGAGTEAAAFQAYGESDPTKTVRTIKKVLRTKYKRRLL